MYDEASKARGKQGPGAGAPGGEEPPSQEGGKKKKGGDDENIIDAEFETK